jgi:hypothetical protein
MQIFYAFPRNQEFCLRLKLPAKQTRTQKSVLRTIFSAGVKNRKASAQKYDADKSTWNAWKRILRAQNRKFSTGIFHKAKEEQTNIRFRKPGSTSAEDIFQSEPAETNRN